MIMSASSAARQNKQAKRKSRGGMIQREEGGAGRAEFALSFYTDAPDEEITLDVFETHAYDRLKLLKSIEAAKAQGSKGKDLTELINKAEREHMTHRRATRNDTESYASPAGKASPNGRDTKLKPDELAHKDSVSHFALRLAYCKTDDQRRWFLQHECMLFRNRFQGLNDSKREAFLSAHGIHIDAVPLKAMEPALREKIEALEEGQPRSRDHIKDTHYLRVPFEQVLQIVMQRRAILEKGIAYVPYSDLLTFIEPRFRMSLSKELNKSSKVVHLVERDERLRPLLTSLREHYLAFGHFKSVGDDNSPEGTLNLNNIEQRYRESMPPCMAGMMSQLKSKHHLKFEGRKQFGAFLKRAGMPVEESLQFWKKSFAGSHVTPEKFEKEYAYGVRYLYGKEGGGKGWAPYSCMRVINSEAPNARAGVVHGCPFKTASPDQLTALMRRMGITANADLKDIADLAKNEHYQISCQRSFNARYKVEALDVVTHPNDYLENAIKELEAMSVAAGVAGTAVKKQKEMV